MNENQLTELKQFFALILKEALFDQSNGLLHEMNRRFDEADEKYMMMFNEILNAIGYRFNDQDVTITQHSATLLNHDNRLLRIESH